MRSRGAYDARATWATPSRSKSNWASRTPRRAARVPGEDGEEPVYPLLTRAKTLRLATDDGRVIRDVALELWDAAKIAEPVRLLGVSVSQLSSSEQFQLDLFRRARGPNGNLGRRWTPSRALWSRCHRPRRRSPRKSHTQHAEKTRGVKPERELVCRPVISPKKRSSLHHLD